MPLGKRNGQVPLGKRNASRQSEFLSAKRIPLGKLSFITPSLGLVVRDIMVFLQSFGLGTNRATRIYKAYGNQAIETIKLNPYCLCHDIHGLGFKTADTIALK